ncbi:MAG TPA: hypothetical protein VJM11_14225 [Nevskiaceae bacterium]|nr:hypothetical protein [Nevskiaceae bacterium]
MRRRIAGAWLGLAAMLFAGACAAEAVADGTYRFYGYAYDLESNRYLYTEVHRATIVDRRWKGGTIDYFAPDGRRIGHKDLSFATDPFIPVFRFEMPELGYAESITGLDPRVELSRSEKGKAAQKALERKPDMAADSGFHNYLLAHFQELLAGKAVPFVFVAAGRLDAFKFRAKRIEDTTWEGRKAVRFQVEADSLLRLVAPSLLVTYDPEQERLLEYRGISNVHDPATGEPFNVRIAYHTDPPPDAPRPLPPLE